MWQCDYILQTHMLSRIQFDDIPGVNPVLGFAPPEPYKLYVTRHVEMLRHWANECRLSYTAFGLGAPIPGTLTIQAASKPNAVFAPYLLTDPLATPEISSVYDGSKVASFDAKSIASGCYAATQNGALAPAISCTIRYTGTKAATGKEVTHDQVFEVKPLDLLGIALAAEKVPKTSFPKNFDGLSSLKPEILTAALPAVDGVTAQMAFDDFVYTANVKKSF
jgi:hypothetical protein